MTATPVKTFDPRMAARKATKMRRAAMEIKTFELKIDNSHLAKHCREHLDLLFLEAKWYYNDTLAYYNNGLCKEAPHDTTKTTVKVKTPDHPEGEERNLNVLASQMKQSIVTRMFDSLSSLSVLRKNKRRTGNLQFKSMVLSVVLKQYGVTYDIIHKHRKVKSFVAFSDKDCRLRIQGLKSKLRVHGLDQIEKFSMLEQDKEQKKNGDKPQKRHIEFGSAKLLKQDDNYYLHITCYADKDQKKIERHLKAIGEKHIGLDFGCETQLTTSNFVKITYAVPVSESIKKQQRILARKKRYNDKISGEKRKKTKNELKTEKKLRKFHKERTNKKNDIKHKIVHVLTSQYKYISFQDENVKGWQGSGHGKKINNTAIGGITRDLKTKSHTPKVIDKKFPSTIECFCGTRVEMPQWERTFRCTNPKHMLVMDRDCKSALKIDVEGMRQEGIIIVPTECRDFKPVETEDSTVELLKALRSIHGVHSNLLSAKQEAHVL